MTIKKITRAGGMGHSNGNPESPGSHRAGTKRFGRGNLLAGYHKPGKHAKGRLKPLIARKSA